MGGGEAAADHLTNLTYSLTTRRSAVLSCNAAHPPTFMTGGAFFCPAVVLSLAPSTFPGATRAGPAAAAAGFFFAGECECGSESEGRGWTSELLIVRG